MATTRSYFKNLVLKEEKNCPEEVLKLFLHSLCHKNRNDVNLILCILLKDITIKIKFISGALSTLFAYLG